MLTKPQALPGTAASTDTRSPAPGPAPRRTWEAGASRALSAGARTSPPAGRTGPCPSDPAKKETARHRRSVTGGGRRRATWQGNWEQPTPGTYEPGPGQAGTGAEETQVPSPNSPYCCLSLPPPPHTQPASKTPASPGRWRGWQWGLGLSQVGLQVLLMVGTEHGHCLLPALLPTRTCWVFTE